MIKKWGPDITFQLKMNLLRTRNEKFQFLNLVVSLETFVQFHPHKEVIPRARLYSLGRNAVNRS